MKRFIEMPFEAMPTTDGTYIVVRPDGTIKTFDYTVKNGWNTDNDSDDTAISTETLSCNYKCWLKPFYLDSTRWATVLDDLILDVQAEIEWYEALKDDDEDVEEIFDTLVELKHYLREAEEITEAFK